MEIGGIVTKLTANADKLGVLAGALTGSSTAPEDFFASIQRLISGQVHMPDFSDLQWWAGQKWLRSCIMAYIAGYAVEELNLPMIGKYGKVIQKGAVGYAAGSLLTHVLYSSTHSGDLGGSSGGRNAGYTY